MLEVWKDIPNYEGLYQVSNMGNVKSLYFNKEKVLKKLENNRGYLYCNLTKNGIKRKFYIHRLVGITFVNNLENKPFINHIDCNPKNNHVENLEWCTPQENTDYMKKLGRNKRTNIWNERRNKSNEKYKKPVIRFNKYNGEIKKYDFMNQVVEDGFKPGDVCKCCKNKRKTAGGYMWRYVE